MRQVNNAACLILLFSLFACNGRGNSGLAMNGQGKPGAAQSSPTALQRAQASATPGLPRATPTATATSTPAPTATEFFTPTPQVDRLTITATVWITNPYVPVMAFHQFFADDIDEESTATKLKLSDFRMYLQGLYDSGYSLVPIENWLKGDLRAPDGRRPLIFSMDDLFYNNQLLLDAKGQPDPSTGIGALWEFSQSHPAFGFSLALFAVLGDKLYADPDKPDWELKLANAIAWCMDHDALVYNHFYTHPRLVQISPRDLLWQAQMNDQYLRKLLKEAGREDLIDRLVNMFALPYGLWPESNSGKKALLDYKTPEGNPVEAVFEIDLIYHAKNMPPPYAKDFDRFHLPRIAAGPLGLQAMIDNKDQVQVAGSCRLSGLEKDRVDDLSYLSGKIQEAVTGGKCPAGIYALNGAVFKAEPSGVKQLLP